MVKVRARGDYELGVYTMKDTNRGEVDVPKCMARWRPAKQGQFQVVSGQECGRARIN